MSTKIFEFGHARPEYAVPVLNERAVRAAAGILFFLAFISFMNAWLIGNFQPTRVFVVSFLIEFTIRIFINPRFAPVMILGEWLVRKQVPEHAVLGGAQERRWPDQFDGVLAVPAFVVLRGGIWHLCRLPHLQLVQQGESATLPWRSV